MQRDTCTSENKLKSMKGKFVLFEPTAKPKRNIINVHEKLKVR